MTLQELIAVKKTSQIASEIAVKQAELIAANKRAAELLLLSILETPAANPAPIRVVNDKY